MTSDIRADRTSTDWVRRNGAPDPAIDRGAPSQFGDAVATALSSGPASRTDLLAAAVAARAPTEVLDSLLRLPERCYHDVGELRSALDAGS